MNVSQAISPIVVIDDACQCIQMWRGLLGWFQRLDGVDSFQPSHIHNSPEDIGLSHAEGSNSSQKHSNDAQPIAPLRLVARCRPLQVDLVTPKYHQYRIDICVVKAREEE
jgi:hypothetical protein